MATFVADHVERRYGHRPGVDADLISRYERGIHTWPSREYREALRTLFSVATDAELGFSPRRTPRQPAGSVDASAPGVAVVPPVGVPLQEVPEAMQRRAFIGRAAALSVGAAVSPLLRADVRIDPATPTPVRVGMVDAEQVESTTRALRALDYQYGGGAAREATLAHLGWAVRLADAASGDVQKRLHAAVADLHNLVGWTAHDLGLHDAARDHLMQALERTQLLGDRGLAAASLYRMGRVHLHCGWPDDALKLFQLAQIGAQDSGSAHAVAMLCANEAWAYAELGDERQALRSLGRAEDELARADLDTAPAWLRYFGETDLSALRGVAHTALSSGDPKHLQPAVAALNASLDGRGPDMARSRAFELTALATVHLRSGDLEIASEVGHQALDFAVDLRSARVLDRLAPLQQAAGTRQGHPDIDELAARLATVRA